MRCFLKLSIFREPNMKMCTWVVYPGPLSCSRVMPFWTWKFDLIHRALCHHNSSQMLNEMFVKLSILQDPNIKMWTLVSYPGLSYAQNYALVNPLILMCSYAHSNIDIHYLNFSSRNIALILDKWIFTKYYFYIGRMDIEKTSTLESISFNGFWPNLVHI